jgi:hypothetical protein
MISEFWSPWIKINQHKRFLSVDTYTRCQRWGWRWSTGAEVEAKSEEWPCAPKWPNDSPSQIISCSRCGVARQQRPECTRHSRLIKKRFAQLTVTLRKSTDAVIPNNATTSQSNNLLFTNAFAYTRKLHTNYTSWLKFFYSHTQKCVNSPLILTSWKIFSWS